MGRIGRMGRMHGQSLDGEWQLSKLRADEWIPAEAPGCVHTDLMAAGVIPDPFIGDNEKRLAWIAETDSAGLRTEEIANGLRIVSLRDSY